MQNSPSKGTMMNSIFDNSKAYEKKLQLLRKDLDTGKFKYFTGF